MSGKRRIRLRIADRGLRIVSPILLLPILFLIAGCNATGLDLPPTPIAPKPTATIVAELPLSTATSKPQPTSRPLATLTPGESPTPLPQSTSVAGDPAPTPTL